MSAPVPPALRAVVWRRDRGICGICHRPVDPARWHADHIIPRVIGGPTVVENLQVSHPLCNNRKAEHILALPAGPALRALGRTFAIAGHLAQLGAPVIPRPIRFASRVSVLSFSVPEGGAHMTPRLAAEIRAAIARADRIMGVPPTHQRAAMWIDGDVLVVQVPRRAFNPILAAGQPAPAGLRFPIGEDMAGQTVWASAGQGSAPHWIIAGATGSGKSEAMLLLAYQLIRAGAMIACADVDAGGTFAPLSGAAAHWIAPAEGPADSVAVILAVRDEMLRRDPKAPGPPLVLFVDELHMLSPAAMRALGDIGYGGRKRSVILVLASHYPKSKQVESVLTGQMGHRLCLRVEMAVQSRTIIEVEGAERLLGHGHAIYRRGGVLTTLQVALVRPQDCAALPQSAGGQAPVAAPERHQPDTKRPPRDLTPLVEQARAAVSAGELLYRGKVSKNAIRQRFSIGADSARTIRDLLTGATA